MLRRDVLAMLAGGAAAAAWPRMAFAASDMVAQSLPMREEPGWFRIGVPQGWQLSADRASGRIGVLSRDGRGVYVWLLLAPRTLHAQEAGALLAGLAGQTAAQARWSSPRVRGQGERIIAAIQGADGGYPLAAGVSIVNVDGVALVFFALAYAPQAAFAQSRETFAAILASFQPQGQGAGGAAAANLRFQRWSDPTENAFSFDIPQGWTARGGIARKSAVDVRSAVQVTSPNRSILIQAGDTEIPPFVEPNEMLREGQWSGPARVKRYTPGAESAREYALWRVKQAMPDMVIEAVQPLRELQHALQTLANSYTGVRVQVDVGEARVRGTWNGKRARAHVLAITRRLSVPGAGAMWFTGDMGTLQGFIATEDQLPTLVAATNRMRESYAVNPQWFQAQQQTTAAASRITTEANRYISDLISRTYAGTQAAQERIYERYSRYQRGVVRVADPSTRTQYEVQTGSNYYWINDRGTIVGTNTHFNPDPLWFREMLQINP